MRNVRLTLANVMRMCWLWIGRTNKLGPSHKQTNTQHIHQQINCVKMHKIPIPKCMHRKTCVRGWGRERRRAREWERENDGPKITKNCECTAHTKMGKRICGPIIIIIIMRTNTNNIKCKPTATNTHTHTHSTGQELRMRTCVCLHVWPLNSRDWRRESSGYNHYYVCAPHISVCMLGWLPFGALRSGQCVCAFAQIRSGMHLHAHIQISPNIIRVFVYSLHSLL